MQDVALDLRSDTVTKPTVAMRAAMMIAEVGDALFDEDPSVLQLEQETAKLFGKEAALFVPSGTMGNQIALRLHCQPGDGLLCSLENHIVRYETGALAGINGIQALPAPLAEDGVQIDLLQLAGHISRAAEVAAPETLAVAVENTHLRAGGRIYPIAGLRALHLSCRELGIGLHMDGARIWHAHVATGVALSEYGAACDTLSVCFSKGLGAPVGSCVVGTKSHIAKAKRLRKAFGGSMRQCGFLAAAASFALKHHIDRLSDDHVSAKLLAAWLRDRLPECTVNEPETNIVFARIKDVQKTPAAALLSRLERDHGLRLSALDTRTLRAVMHLDAPQAALRARLS